MVCLILQVILLTVQSVLLGSLTDYFALNSPNSSETRDAYLLALGVSLIAMFTVVAVGTASYCGYKLGMLVRIICTSAIYEKVLIIMINQFYCQLML